MFISIGPACNVKYNIRKYKKSDQTLFFDWLGANMSSVNKIMGVKDINDILFFKNIVHHKENHNKKNSTFYIKSLNYCVSIHDIPLLFNSSHIIEFIKKYKKRYNRIIDIIKKSKSTIYFIRASKISSEEKRIFINNIQKINPKCNFKLVELLDIKNPKHFINETHFISINLYKYKIKNIVKGDWTTSHWAWKKLFNDISKFK